MSQSVTFEQPRADAAPVADPEIEVSVRRATTLTGRTVQLRRDDEWLAARVGRVEPEPFEVLAARWRPRLHSYCLRRLRSREEADDAVQEILERAYRRLARAVEVEEPHRLGPLMFTIARNACIDRLRAQSRMLEGTLDEESPSLALSVGEWVERRDQFDATLRDMRSLSDRQREALLLREMCGLSGETIAERLGVTTMAAKSLISEARRVLLERRAGRELDCEAFRLLVAATRQPHRSHRLQAHVDGCTRCQLAPVPVRRASAFVPALLAAGAGRWLSRAGHAGVAAPAGAALKAAAVATVVAAGAGVAVHLTAPVRHSAPAASRVTWVSAPAARSRPATPVAFAPGRARRAHLPAVGSSATWRGAGGARSLPAASSVPSVPRAGERVPLPVAPDTLPAAARALVRDPGSGLRTTIAAARGAIHELVATGTAAPAAVVPGAARVAPGAVSAVTGGI